MTMYYQPVLTSFVYTNFVDSCSSIQKNFHFNATLQSKILLLIVRSHTIQKEIFSHAINSLSALFIFLCKPGRHNTMDGLH